MDISELFGKMQEIQENMKKYKENLDSLTAEGSSGGGMVIATATGSKKIIKIKIDPEVIDKNDPEMLEDLICAAVNNALENIETKAKEELNKMTSNLLPNLPNIPGLDLSKFGL
jgi:DNA-binding YbaB/EbfC family protein